MRKTLFVIMALAISSLAFSQGVGSFTRLSVRDSIYFGGRWYVNFSSDSTLGDGPDNILPTQGAVKKYITSRESVYDTSFAHYKWVIQRNTRSIFTRILGAANGSPVQISMFNIGDSFNAMLAKYLIGPLSKTLVDGGKTNNNAPYASGIGEYLAGRDLQVSSSSSGYTSNFGDNLHWPSGVDYKINSGGTINWNTGGGNPTFTKLKLFYFTEPGAGTLSVSVGGSVVATIDCNAATDTTLNVYTYTKSVGASAVSTSVSGAGPVVIAEAHIIDTTYNGVDLYTVGRFGISMDSMFARSAALRALSTYLKEAQPDIMTYEAKESVVYNDSSTYGYRLNQLADILDTTMSVGAKIWIGSSPTQTSVTTHAQEKQNDTLFRIAHERGYIYWDGYNPLKSYDELVKLKWAVNDGVHLSDTAHAYRAGLLWQDLGVDNMVMGYTPRAVQDRQHPSHLGDNTTFGVNTNRQFRIRGESSGQDWYFNFRRGLSFTDSSSTTTVFRISNNVSGLSNILPSTFTIGAYNSGRRFSIQNATTINTAVFTDSAQAGLNLPIKSGFITPGPYTTAQLQAISSNNTAGSIASVSDGPGYYKLMFSRGNPNTWIPITSIYQAQSNSYFPAFAVYDSTSAGNYYGNMQLGVTTASTVPSLSFWLTTAGSVATERMRIQPDGKLLVGTTTDDASGNLLQVNGGITATRMKLTSGFPGIGKVLTDTTGTGVGAWRTLSVPTLQNVSLSGNKTSQWLTVTGMNSGVDTVGLHLGASGGSGMIWSGNPVSGTYSQLNMFNAGMYINPKGTFQIATDNNGSIIIGTGGSGTMTFNSSSPVQFNTYVQGNAAIQSNQFVVKRQLDSLASLSPGTPTFSPSASVNDILGTGYSVNITGKGDAMKVTFTTGTGITTNGTIGSIVLNTAFGSVPYTVSSAADVGSIGAQIGFNATTAGSITAFCKTTLSESTTYNFNLISKP